MLMNKLFDVCVYNNVWTEVQSCEPEVRSDSVDRGPLALLSPASCMCLSSFVFTLSTSPWQVLID